MASVKRTPRAYVFERSKLESGTHVVRPGERRDIARIPVDILARIEWSGRDTTGVIANLGIGGAFVRSALSPSYGSYVHLCVEHGGKPIHLVGVVRWTDEIGFGVQFERMGAYETSIIAGYIARARAKLLD